MEKNMGRTKEQMQEVAKAQLEACAALAEAIRGANGMLGRGAIPDGHLYAQVMGHLSLEQYNGLINILIRAGLVERTPGHVLKWVGPKKEGV
jgi:hypothetical protein